MSLLLRTYAGAIAATLAIWVGVAVGYGWHGLYVVVLLTGLEMTLSFDNAAVNAHLLVRLPPWWQRMFLTVGIVVAVFVIRAGLPAAILAVTGRLGPEGAQAGVAAFGGTFLTMIAIEFFLDETKDIHWWAPVERRLVVWARYTHLPAFAMTLLTIIIATSAPAPPATRLVIAVSMAAGMAVKLGLDLLDAITEGPSWSTAVVTGTAAAVLFARLEVLDASFSLDGVVGAFAVTTNIVLIAAGLGAGAVWVRSMTIHLVRAGTLDRYRYLRHGAHAAIGLLATVLLARLYGWEAPDYLVGAGGAALIAAAVVSSHHRHPIPPSTTTRSHADEHLPS